MGWMASSKKSEAVKKSICARPQNFAARNTD
jgi:hypothetical protein